MTNTKKIAMTLAVVLGMSTNTLAATGDLAGSFTMLDGANGSVGFDDAVVGTWTGETGTGQMTIASDTPFFGVNWTAHDITVYDPGTYTVDSVQAGSYEFQVGAGQIGAHMLFDWGATSDIDVIVVWDYDGTNLVSTDVVCNWDYDVATETMLSLDPIAADGILGAPMIDGAFIGFNANFDFSADGGSGGDNGGDTGGDTGGSDSCVPPKTDDIDLQADLTLPNPVSSTLSNFTMLTPDGDLADGSDQVDFYWDGTLNTSVEGSVVNATKTTDVPFFAVPWFAHHVKFFGPGSYTFETCPDDGSSKCTAPQPLNLVVPEGQIGAHMLFNWGATVNIDMVVLFEEDGVFDGPIGRSDPTTEWDLVSVDADGDGIPGTPFVDGPFKGFSGSMNLLFQDPAVDPEMPLIVIPGSNPLAMKVGGTFVEPAVTVYDAVEACTLSGQILKTGTVDANTPGTYFLDYLVVDGHNNEASDTLIVVVHEDDKPVVSLLGDSTIYRTLGDAYQEPGFVATDLAADGSTTDLTESVVVTGSVPVQGEAAASTKFEDYTTTAGTFTITYAVTDADNNTTQVARTVVVTADPGETVRPFPDSKSELGCSVSNSPVNPMDRADLIVLAAFVSVLGLAYRRQSKQN